MTREELNRMKADLEKAREKALLLQSQVDRAIEEMNRTVDITVSMRASDHEIMEDIAEREKTTVEALSLSLLESMVEKERRDETNEKREKKGSDIRSWSFRDLPITEWHDGMITMRELQEITGLSNGALWTYYVRWGQSGFKIFRVRAMGKNGKRMGNSLAFLRSEIEADINGQINEDEYVTFADIVAANQGTYPTLFWYPLVRDSEINGVRCRKMERDGRKKWFFNREDARRVLGKMGYVVP